MCAAVCVPAADCASTVPFWLQLRCDRRSPQRRRPAVTSVGNQHHCVAGVHQGGARRSTLKLRQGSATPARRRCGSPQAMLAPLLAAAALAATIRSASPPAGCPLYLRRSHVRGGGTGVFAGADIPHESFVESCPSISIPKASAAACALTNYCYAHNETHDTVVLGLGMMWNHHPEPHVHNVWAGVGTVGRNEPPPDEEAGVDCDERYPLCDTAFFASGRAAARGEEVYGYYGGGRSWFESRGIRLTEPSPAAVSTNYGFIVLYTQSQDDNIVQVIPSTTRSQYFEVFDMF